MLYGPQLPEGLLNLQQQPEMQLPQVQPQFKSAREFFASPQFMALAAGILSQAGPSREPTSLAKGLAVGMQGMQQANQQYMDNKLRMDEYGLRTQELQNRIKDNASDRVYKERKLKLEEDEYNRKLKAREELDKLLLGEDDTITETTPPPVNPPHTVTDPVQKTQPNNTIIPEMDMNAPNVVGPYDPIPIPNPNATQNTTTQVTPPPIPTKKENVWNNLNDGQKKLAKAYIAAGHEDKALEIIQGAQPDTKTIFSNENTLRDEFDNKSKNFIAIRDSYDQIRAAADQNDLSTGSGDIALVYSFMKMLDPTSTVREGEYATAENAGGAFSKYGNIYNRLLEGKFLTPEMRTDFVTKAGQLYNARLKNHEQLEKQYGELATGYKLNPKNVVMTYRASESNAPNKSRSSITVSKPLNQMTMAELNELERQLGK